MQPAFGTPSDDIAGGDFDRAGLASSRLKERLKQVGVDAAAIRRAMIASYEAEMNVVIHASRGRMVASMEDGRIDVRVEDEGPGIPDIDRAMQEGFSTAPPEAIALGFGAGMGLPNIQRHSDRFTIQSTPGQGTQVEFSICFKPQFSPGSARHAIQARPESCIQCLRCLRACPVGALRVHGAGPQVLDHLCVDCPVCVATCPTAALAMDYASELPDAAGGLPLILPSPALVQFGPDVHPAQVQAALSELGFGDIRLLDRWVRALGHASRQYAAEEAGHWPVIPPLCPAVVNLIELRFPALLGHLAPFLSPWEAAAREVASDRAVFVVLCPCQRTAIDAEQSTTKVDMVAPSALVRAVTGKVKATPMDLTRTDGVQADAPAADDLVVSGVHHVLKVLDELENGLLEAVGVLELYMCDQGCFGAPLLSEDAFVARRLWMRAAIDADSPAEAFRRQDPFVARPGMRLDPDMSKAIAKLAQMDAQVKALPGRDCAMCGAPTCAALAEDIVLDRATRSACVHCCDSEDRAR